MTKAESLYCGKYGLEYWDRNIEQLDKTALERKRAIRGLIPHLSLMRWLEVGCGRGHNMTPGDVGLDCDMRNLEHLPTYCTGVHGRAYRLPFPDRHFAVVFSVGCLMHIQSCPLSKLEGDQYVKPYDHRCESWQSALAEMARVAKYYVIVGEYWSDEEKEIEWHGHEGALWARPYHTIGLEEVRRFKPFAPFDENVTFVVFGKVELGNWNPPDLYGSLGG